MKENQELYKQIGNRIKKARKASGYTQEKLSELIDVSVQYISDLERGVVGTSIPTLIRICTVLHVSSDEILMGRTDDSSSEDDNSADLVRKIQKLPKEQRAIMDRGVQLFMESFSYTSKR